MDTDLRPRGQKRLLDDEYLSSSPWRNPSSSQEPETYPLLPKGIDPHQGSTSTAMESSAVKDEMRIAEELMNESKFEDNDPKDCFAQGNMPDVKHEESYRKRVRFSERTRQGSAPPRLELGINEIHSHNMGRRAALSYLRDQKTEDMRCHRVHPDIGDSITHSDRIDVATQDKGAHGDTNAKARMEGLLDDLETEVTCGLCAGVFIDVSFRLGT